MSKDIFKNRYNIVQGIIITFAVIFVLRLFYLQIIDRKYVSLARNNAVKELDVYPTRGYVYDRNGELIVYNEAIYDLMVIPRQAKGIDTAKLCELLGITKDDYEARLSAMRSAKGFSSYKPNVFMKQLSLKFAFAGVLVSLPRVLRPGAYYQKIPPPLCSHHFGRYW